MCIEGAAVPLVGEITKKGEGNDAIWTIET
jgi:hypothetical protein